MGSSQSARRGYGIRWQDLHPAAAVIAVATLIAVVCCFSDAQAAGKKKPRKKAQPSVAKKIPDAKANKTAKADKTVAAQRGRNKLRASRQLDEAVLRYLPENCRAFATLDLAAIVASEIGEDVLPKGSASLAEVCGSLAPLGLEVEQIERIALGAPSLVGGDFSEYVAVLFCKRPPGESTGFSPEGTPWTTERIGPTTLWIKGGDEPWAVCAVDDRIALAGPPDSIRKVLKRDAPATLPEKLDHARRLNDPAATFAVSFLPDGLEAAAMGFGFPALASRVEAINMEAEFDTDLATRWAVICRDKESAQQVNAMVSGILALVQMQGLQNQEQQVREMICSVSFDVEGPVFRVNMKLPRSMIQFETKDATTPAVAGCVPAVAQYPLATATLPAPVTPPSPYAATPYATPSTPTVTPYSTVPSAPAGNYLSAPVGYTAATTPQSSPYATSWNAPPRPATPVLTALKLSDVVRLVEAGVDEKVIIRHVKKHYLAAPLAADDLILLTESKATTKVITTLQEIPAAPKSKPASKTPAKWDPYASPQPKPQDAPATYQPAKPYQPKGAYSASGPPSSDPPSSDPPSSDPPSSDPPSSDPPSSEKESGLRQSQADVKRLLDEPRGFWQGDSPDDTIPPHAVGMRERLAEPTQCGPAVGENAVQSPKG